MKEATGELNMTVVVVVTVGVLSAFFYTTIWPLIRDNFNSKSKCSDAICYPTGDGYASCVYYDKDGIAQSHFKCVWKG